MARACSLVISGIHLINLATRMAAERQREFFLMRGPEHIQRMFGLAGITDRLPFAD